MPSPLQRYILRELYISKKARPSVFQRFYQKISSKTKTVDQQTSIVRSIERMIDGGLLIGRGRKTKDKWFIDEVTLTPLGRRKAKSLFEQQTLPLFIRKRKKYANSKKS